MSKPYPKDAGFTLVEVLISLFIFALISAGTMGAMFQTFAAKERLDMASTELADIAAFRAIIRADMSGMEFRPMRDGVGGTENYLVTTRNPAEPNAILTFTRLGRSNPAEAARGQAERVRYLVRDGQFIRESLIHENPAQLGGWSGRILLENIEDVDVIYRRNSIAGSAAPGNLLVEEWIVLNTDSVAPALTDGAVEFKLRIADGVETSHLFELGI